MHLKWLFNYKLYDRYIKCKPLRCFPRRISQLFSSPCIYFEFYSSAIQCSWSHWVAKDFPWIFAALWSWFPNVRLVGKTWCKCRWVRDESEWICSALPSFFLLLLIFRLNRFFGSPPIRCNRKSLTTNCWFHCFWSENTFEEMVKMGFSAEWEKNKKKSWQNTRKNPTKSKMKIKRETDKFSHKYLYNQKVFFAFLSIKINHVWLEIYWKFHHTFDSDCFIKLAWFLATFLQTIRHFS